jgi:hypothetical protein
MRRAVGQLRISAWTGSGWKSKDWAAHSAVSGWTEGGAAIGSFRAENHGETAMGTENKLRSGMELRSLRQGRNSLGFVFEADNRANLFGIREIEAGLEDSREFASFAEGSEDVEALGSEAALLVGEEADEVGVLVHEVEGEGALEVMRDADVCGLQGGILDLDLVVKDGGFVGLEAMDAPIEAAEFADVVQFDGVLGLVAADVGGELAVVLGRVFELERGGFGGIGAGFEAISRRDELP